MADSCKGKATVTSLLRSSWHVMRARARVTAAARPHSRKARESGASQYLHTPESSLPPSPRTLAILAFPIIYLAVTSLVSVLATAILETLQFPVPPHLPPRHHVCPPPSFAHCTLLGRCSVTFSSALLPCYPMAAAVTFSSALLLCYRRDDRRCRPRLDLPLGSTAPPLSSPIHTHLQRWPDERSRATKCPWNVETSDRRWPLPSGLLSASLRRRPS